MLNYVATIAISAFFVPHYLSIFWGPLRENPWDIVGGIVIVVLVLAALNIVGIQESARLNVVLAVVDFVTQVLLVGLGFVLVFSPAILRANIHWGVAPTWSQFFLAIPVAMLAYTGIETVSNLAEEARDPVRTIPNSIKLVAGAVFTIYFTLPWVALSAMPVTKVNGKYQTLLGEPPPQGFANDPVLGDRREPRPARRRAQRGEDLRRHPRRDDPLHRHERGRDRRLADHLRDGELPAAARRLPAPPPALQDAVALDPVLRGDRAGDRDPAGQDRVPRHDLRLRRDLLVHRRAREHRLAARPPRGGRPRVPGAAEPQVRGTQLAAVRDPRRDRHRPLVARDRGAVAGRALGRARAGSRSGRSSSSSTAAGSCTSRSRRRCARRS